MQQIIREQFTSRQFDEKGQSRTIPDYTVTVQPATNHLIVRCPTEADIDAVLEVLNHVDIPPTQVKIECLVSELYADITVDRETTVLIENLLGEGVTLGGKSDNRGNLLPAFPGASLRDLAREKFGLRIGVNSPLEGHTWKTLVDILVSRGYLKILMNPTLKVMNGQTARIHSRQHVPLQQISVRGGSGDSLIESRTEYYDIVDSLEVTPYAYAGGHVRLDTQIRISAHLTPEGVRQTPIVTECTITSRESRIRLGESLVIGGMRKNEKRDVTRGTPVLKDIPFIGFLFSGRDFEERAKEVIFILTPTISTRGEPRETMIDTMRQRHSSPLTLEPDETVIGPPSAKD